MFPRPLAREAVRLSVTFLKCPHVGIVDMLTLRIRPECNDLDHCFLSQSLITDASVHRHALCMCDV